MNRLQSIRRPADYRRILDSGRRRKVGGLVVVRSPGQPNLVRYGLVAGKRIGNAVQRNRIKRRLRAAVATAQIEPGFDYVLIPTAEVATVGFSRLVEWVAAAGGAER